MLASLALESWDARWQAIFRLPAIAYFFTMSGPLLRGSLPQAASSANRARRLPKNPTWSSSWCRIRHMWKRSCSAQAVPRKEFRKKINARGADYLDAPVSGGEVGAKAASLTIMVGGPERAFNTMKPLFEKMGKNVTLVGGNGDGQTTKVANQIIVALTIEAVGEALLFASKAGADPALVRQALMGGFASSRILEVHGERMVKRNFDPGFRIELHQKDLNLALEGARALGLSLPNTAVAQQLFNSCTAHGGKAWDHSAMVRALETMASHEIGKSTRPKTSREYRLSSSVA